MPYKKIDKVCLICNKNFMGRPNQKYCSLSCTYKDSKLPSRCGQFGKNNPNWKGGRSNNHYFYKKRQKEKFPDRIKAREKISYAIKSGKISRGNCEVCKEPNAHAHHDDYEKPLEVRWFCRKHHRELHNNEAIA